MSRLGDNMRFVGWAALAVPAGLLLIAFLRGSFRPFGFLTDALLILIVAVGVLYLWILWKRPGRGPASENLDDLVAAAKVKLERGEISEEDFARIKGNLRD